VCEVRYTEWTREGGLRHPAFMGMRSGVKPEDCHAPEPMRIEADGNGAAPPEAQAAKGARSKPRAAGTAPGERHEVALTNLKKKFWPDGATKGDLVGFYEKIAPLLLPYLRDRPVVLTRYPDGIEGKFFFQKDAPVYVPDWVRTEVIHAKDVDRDIRYFVIDDADMLRYVANMGTIPLHVWNARVASLDRPDWMVLDLDPKEAPFAHVVQVARALKKILDDLELPSYPKTSGATGLHVLLPMGQRYTHEEVRTFARLLATMVVETLPEISTVVRAIKGRGGKVYVDFGQNGHGNTIVAPYSVRPLPGAPASCPLQWDEVNARLDPARFTIRSIPERFEEMDDPLAPVLGKGIDMAKAIVAIERRMAGD
jgi:bifunctional non-homologous end joining protein LigD